MVEITGTTQLICLLGSPVTHSVSPAMHNMAFSLLGLDYAYLAFEVGETQLAEAVKGLKLLNARGWNLTMPNKTKMCELVDELSPASQLMEAVNTVVSEDGVLKGYTTDGSGYMRMLREYGVDVIHKKMVLGGAGGAARAIAIQAALDGVAEIVIFNRSLDKAVKIADDINRHTGCIASAYSIADTAQLSKALESAALFTNATQIGMAPRSGQSVIEDKSLLHPGLVVSDIVYNPRETKLLKMAEEQGCKTVGGLGMLLWQGADAFKLWTGHEMPVYDVQNKYFK